MGSRWAQQHVLYNFAGPLDRVHGVRVAGAGGDLGVFHRQARTISLREATAWSVVWVVVSLAFNFLLLHFSGRTAALEFLAVYVIEKSLSVDNLFGFVLLFRYFAVESRYQHRMLHWGVLGALIMRGVLIGMGVALISRYKIDGVPCRMDGKMRPVEVYYRDNKSVNGLMVRYVLKTTVQGAK